MDAYIGQVCFFAFTYPIRDWMPCDGRLLTIQQYPALYAVIGTYYGGDGQVNFALPDLRGRVPVGVNVPPVAGRLPASQVGANGGSTSLTVPPANSTVAVETTTQTGSTVAHVQPPQPIQAPLPPPPFQTLNAFICVNGIFPTRDD